MLMLVCHGRLDDVIVSSPLLFSLSPFLAAFLLSLRPHMIKTAKQDKTRWGKGAAAACSLFLLLLVGWIGLASGSVLEKGEGGRGGRKKGIVGGKIYA